MNVLTNLHSLSLILHYSILENEEQVHDNDETENKEEAFSQGDGNTTETIVVANVPSAADEDVLELLFESKRKGGGHVKHVQLNREKNWAIIEFCEPDAVEAVMSKLPITLMGTELEIHPYTPLIPGGVVIRSLDIRGLPKELTDDLLAKDVEKTIGSIEASSAEYESDDEHSEPKAEMDEHAGSQILINLKSIQVRMLTTIKFQESMSETFPNVTVTINLEKNEVHLDGDNAAIQLVKMKLYETLSTYVVCVFDDISAGMLEICQSKRVTEYINKQLASKKLVCLVWEIKDECLVICGVHEDVNKCARIIRGSVKEENFPISKESAAVFWSNQWQDKLKALRRDSDVFCEVISSGDVINATVFARYDKVAELVGKVKRFLREQAKVKSEKVRLNQLGKKLTALSELDDDIWEVFWEKLISKIEKDLSIHFVSVDDWYSLAPEEKFSVTGAVEGRDLAKKRLKSINL